MRRYHLYRARRQATRRSQRDKLLQLDSDRLYRHLHHHHQGERHQQLRHHLCRRHLDPTHMGLGSSPCCHAHGCTVIKATSKKTLTIKHDSTKIQHNIQPANGGERQPTFPSSGTCACHIHIYLFLGGWKLSMGEFNQALRHTYHAFNFAAVANDSSISS